VTRAGWALAAAGLLLGCAHVEPPLHPPSPAGVFYVARAGETLAMVADRQRVPLEDLAEINGLPPAAALAEGQVIFVLQPEDRLAAAPASSPDIMPPAELPEGSARARAATGSFLQWPLDTVTLSSGYGKRWGRLHEGIDLAAAAGTEVRAARAGVVLYAGSSLPSYGHMVVLQHDGDFLTAYAHNSALLVRVGQQVRAGQVIARVGKSGRATAPHLHFELRKGQVPQNPLPFLPRRP
jgi:biotin carboxyl carrier protein